MSNDTKTVNIKDSILNEQKEIAVKTFFGHEIKVRSGGSYEVLTGGIKGLIDKIIWFFFVPTLESRKAAVEKSPKNNNSQVPNEKPKLNNWSEQDSLKTTTTSDDLDKTNQSLSEKNTKMADNSDDSNFQLFSNLEDNIKDQTNINNDYRNNSSIKERESGNMGNEFSVFGNEDNDINFVNGQNSARTDVNNMVHDSSVLSEEELAEIEGQINDLRKIGSYTEEDLVLLKQNFIKEAIEKKKNDKKNAEYQQQLEKVIEQSKSENEDIEKRYKEVENNLKKIIPEGYRVTSFDKGDEIIGDGNCFYRAIAKLENENQERYGEIRKTISDEINKSAELVGKSADKIDNNLLTLIQLYAWEYNELKDVEEVNENNLSGVLYQIKEHVEGKDKKNEYAGPIEAYFYAKAAKKTVILYDSSNQVHVFIPDKKGDSVHVEHVDPDKIENHIKENKIDIANAVKLAYNATGKHYEAIVPVDVKN